MLDLLVLAVLLVLALGVGRRMLRAVPFAYPLEESLYAIALGLGLLAYVTLALGEAGLLRLPILLAVLAGGAVYGRAEIRASAALAARGLRRWRESGPSRSEIAVLLLGAALVAAEVVLDLAPAVGGDQTKYQLVYPRLFADAHRLVDTPWSFWGYVQYLMNMLFAAAFVLRGDALARLLNAAFGVLTMLAVFAGGRRLFSRRVGVWAAALFATMPMTATLMTRAWVEFALTLYVLLAVLAVFAWREGGGRSWLALGAVMGGLAGGTKVMGVLAPALLGLVVFVEAWRGAGSSRFGTALRATVGFGLLAALVASPCYLRNVVATGNPVFPFGYGVFGGRHWNAEAAAGLDAYYAGYREAQAARRGAGAYANWRDALRFPWDATMAPYSFEETSRSAYDVGPFLLAFVPGVLLLRRDPRALLLAGLAGAYAAAIVLGMWAHPRYVHPALPLLLLVAVQALDTLRARGRLAARLVTIVLAATVAGQTVIAVRVVAPLWPDAFAVAIGRRTPEEFLARHERRFALWSLVNREVPVDGNVLVLGMIPHPYHLERPFTLASPLEQAVLDYRRMADVDDLVSALGDLGVTHVAREEDREDKPFANPIGAHVTALWDGLLARCEKVGDTPGGTLYRLTPAVGGRPTDARSRG